jgi:hypothetical protein
MAKPCSIHAPWHLQEAAPGLVTEQRAADVVRAFVPQHLGITLEVVDSRHAQDQAWGFKLDIGSSQTGSSVHLANVFTDPAHAGTASRDIRTR